MLTSIIKCLQLYWYKYIYFYSKSQVCCLNSISVIFFICRGYVKLLIHDFLLHCYPNLIQSDITLKYSIILKKMSRRKVVYWSQLSHAILPFIIRMKFTGNPQRFCNQSVDFFFFQLHLFQKVVYVRMKYRLFSAGYHILSHP